MVEIADEMARRRLAMDPVIERMIEVRDRNNGDVIVPVPESDDDLPLHSLAPLLIADAIEQPALYAAQQPPSVIVPALEPGKPMGVRSIDFASRRRKAIYQAWDNSWWELFIGRMYRHLNAYASSAVVVEPDFQRVGPRMTLRDPLMAYPEPKAPEDLGLPCNVGFIQAHSLEWLHYNFPETKARFPRNAFVVSSSGEGEMWDVVEWMDEDETVIGVLGPRDIFNSWVSEPIRWCMELRRFPNPLGRCPAVVPRRVTLDRIISQLSNLVGHADLIARLMYLDIRATEDSVMPSRYVLAKTGQNPRLVDGKWHEGYTGEVNLIVDADAVGELRATPDPNNKATMDRVERNLRVSSGLIPQTGGETYGALRTGRGIDALTGAALDPRTSELHHVAERYLGEVNELILLTYRKVWPSRKFSVGAPADPERVEFVPDEHIEKDRDGKLYLENRVRYPMPGMDDITSTQVIGQMLGAQLLSQYHARRLHPHVPDPEGVERQLMVEQLQSMILASVGQRAVAGGIPPEDIAMLTDAVTRGVSITDAVILVQRAAQERQAAEPPPPGPGQMAAPEAMPGLANPGEGQEMGQPGGAAPLPPPSAVENVRALAQAYAAPA